MTATIDLGSLQPVSSIRIRCLQDINSWVFMPTRVVFRTSVDGVEFQEVGAQENEIPETRWGPIVAPREVVFPARKVRYVQVVAASHKICPTWHKGSGGPAWIFVDEIIVK